MLSFYILCEYLLRMQRKPHHKILSSILYLAFYPCEHCMLDLCPISTSYPSMFLSPPYLAPYALWHMAWLREPASILSIRPCEPHILIHCMQSICFVLIWRHQELSCLTIQALFVEMPGFVLCCVSNWFQPPIHWLSLKGDFVRSSDILYRLAMIRLCKHTCSCTWSQTLDYSELLSTPWSTIHSDCSYPSWVDQSVVAATVRRISPRLVAESWNLFHFLYNKYTCLWSSCPSSLALQLVSLDEPMRSFYRAIPS